MLRKNLVLTILMTLAASTSWGQAADVFLVKRATELRSAPGDSSPSLGALPEKSQVTRLTQRQGAWVEIKTAQGTVGWLHMFDLTTAASAASSGGATGAFRGISNFFNRGGTQQAGSGQTSTVGIRGLGAEDLARSQPNLAAVTQAEGLRQSGDQARSFARDAGLTPQKVEALPVPPEPNQAGNNPPGG